YYFLTFCLSIPRPIPSHKASAFFPCAVECAKSHLKWAEALRIRVVFGIRELLRRFGYFWAPKVTKNLNFVFCLAHFCHYLPINLVQIFPSQHDTRIFNLITLPDGVHLNSCKTLFFIVHFRF